MVPTQYSPRPVPGSLCRPFPTTGVARVGADEVEDVRRVHRPLVADGRSGRVETKVAVVEGAPPPLPDPVGHVTRGHRALQHQSRRRVHDRHRRRRTPLGLRRGGPRVRDVAAVGGLSGGPSQGSVVSPPDHPSFLRRTEGVPLRSVRVGTRTPPLSSVLLTQQPITPARHPGKSTSTPGPRGFRGGVD